MSGRTGVTDCPAHSTTCQAGTYCNPENSFTYCLGGCTSDNNCAENEHCLKCDPQSAYGTCQACGATCEQQATSCTASSVKVPACGSPGVVYGCKKLEDEPPATAGQCTELPVSDTPAGSIIAYCCGGEVNPCVRSTQEDHLCTGANKAAYACGIGQHPPAACASPFPGAPVVCCPS